MITVKKTGEDPENCREYYKDINTGHLYCTVQFKNNIEWFTTTNFGEPECKVEAEFNIVGNYDIESKSEKEMFEKLLMAIRGGIV